MATTAPSECLHCGETPDSIRREGITVCGIVGGYEYRELEQSCRDVLSRSERKVWAR